MLLDYSVSAILVYSSRSAKEPCTNLIIEPTQGSVLVFDQSSLDSFLTISIPAQSSQTANHVSLALDSI